MPQSPQPNKKGRPRGSGSFAWRAFFQQSTTPIFVLGKARRLRFANAACEKLVGAKLPDLLGMVCSNRRHSSPLAATLAPTAEAQAGKADTARRPAPGHRNGPPWWDIAFTPLNGDDGIFGIVGVITVVSETVPVAARRVPPSVANLREKHGTHFSLDLFAGNAPASVRFAVQLRHAAEATAPVWLKGEPGSGKETAARVIHHAGNRKNAAFVGLDCAGLQPYLLESLLFGHGGILGTEHVGTLYLKDPTALPRDLQQRLAEVFTQQAAGTPRLISGSPRTAAEEVAAGKLVPDFHTALSVLEPAVPPLRECLADLPRLASRLIPDIAIDPSTFDVLLAQPWRGNVRELADTLAEAAALAAGMPIKPEHLSREMRERAGIELPPVPPKPIALDELLKTIEAKLVRLALERTGGNATAAAESLDIGRIRVVRQVKTKIIRKPEDKT